MNVMRALLLLDSNGKPIDSRIERVLAGLIPKLRRRFPSLQDEVVLADVVEEVGRRIATREERSGLIEHLHGYAWVTVRSVATSYLRRPATRLMQMTLEPEASQTCIALAATSYGSPEEVERGILLREALDTLPPEVDRQWSARVQPLVDQWVKDTPGGDKVLAAFRTYVAEAESEVAKAAR